MGVRISDYGRTAEMMKLQEAKFSTGNKEEKPVEKKPSGELYTDAPAVKLEISRTRKESLKTHIYCRPMRNNLGALYSEMGDAESLIEKEKQAIKAEQEQRTENEAFLEELDEQLKTSIRDFVMQCVRESIDDTTKMLANFALTV